MPTKKEKQAAAILMRRIKAFLRGVNTDVAVIHLLFNYCQVPRKI